MQRGKKHCQEHGYRDVKVFQDTGSGLNARRRGLKKLCRAIERGEIERLVLTYSDRLTRFGFDYLTRYFSSHGTAIEVIEREKNGEKDRGENRSLEKELVDDLIAIVTSFSGKVHGLRSSRSRKKKAREKREEEFFQQQMNGNGQESSD